MSRTHRAETHKTSLPGLDAVTLASDRAFPRHSHDQFGIGVVIFGGHRSWSGIGEVEAGPGDIIMVNPGEVHDGAPLGGPRGWRMLYLDPDIVSGEVAAEMQGDAEIARPAVRDPLLARRFAALFGATTAAATDTLATEENLTGLIMHVLARHGTRSPARGRTPSIRRVLDRLDSAPERSTTLAELAGIAGASRFQLLRGFAREVGVTPHAYLLQRRVGLARRLLAAGETPVEAAIQAGFADQSHMSRAFLRQFGITPGRYRAARA